MGVSISDNFKAIKQYLPPSLLKQPGILALEAVLRFFPASVYTTVVMESRLIQKDEAVDVAFNVLADTRKFLIDFFHSPGIEESFLKIESWKLCYDFIKEWEDESSPSHRYVDFIWFEFDQDQMSFPVPIPFFFIHFHNRLYELLNSVQERFEWMQALINRVAGKELSIGENLLRCLNVSIGRIIYIGFMPSRSTDKIRVIFNEITREDIYTILTKLGLNTLCESVRISLNGLCYDFVDLRLHVDISETIDPKVSVEFHIKHNMNLQHQDDWKPFLKELVEKGYSVEEKAKGLLAWPGLSREFFDPFLFKYYTSRHIYQFKAVYQEGCDVEYKAYFSFSNSLIQNTPQGESH